MEACRGLRQATLSIHYAPTQVALTRRCSGVPKLTYLLRLNGDRVHHTLLAMFDSQLRSVVSASVIGGPADHSWWQTEVLFWGLSAFARHSPLFSRPSLRAGWSHVHPPHPA